MAIIADASSPFFGRLTELSEAHRGDAAEFLIANSAEMFAREHGAEKLQLVESIVLAVFAGGNAQVVEGLWPLCPNVRWVHSLAAGVDTLLPVLRPLPRIGEVQITNAKGAFSRSLAEYCIMAMLHFNKQVPRVQENKKARRWEKFEMAELHGKTVGFVGFGDIGQATARLCKAFGMKVLALRRNKAEPSEADMVFGIDDLEERMKVFESSDFIVCSLPGTPETRHFCGANEFAAMKDSAIFISIGRGVCVDEVALCEALQSSSIGGAALDVFEKEPLDESSPVWDAPNLMLTAHNADLTKTYMEDTWAVFMKTLEQFRASPGTFRGTVSLERGY
eukprot:CAMPEP_0117537350 /NCGR_PEP_ID=MMETSP0784-20121206/41918_1 /TAXON_ID=39447 /ORGANISM="" /LENGTH=334 /DNA_ID=CAMNT_0005333931 /DNA_START=85 /DNA_END=1089 /DNA_ORIENTATION=-